jgi:DNA-binding NarL/FixJ family response regulator
LIGRDAELARLQDALDGLGPGLAPVFEVVGEPGIGKTRLIGEIVARAHERRYLVASGQAAEFEEEVPFGVVVDALDAYLGSQNRRRFAGMSEDQKGELAAVFPSLAELAEPRAEVLQHERYRAHHAVRTLLELLAGERPCLLVLDDMHWADQASLELLSHLLRRRPEAPVLIVLAFRPPQAPERLRTPLERAERAGVAVRLDLGPLSRAEAEGLLDPALGEIARDRLYSESGGNPFYLEQLGRARHGGESREASSSPAPVAPALEAGSVPDGVSASIAAEVAGLTPESRVVLQGAAVVGDPFAPELAAAAAAVSEPEALETLNELIGLDLIRPGEVPIEFRFRHPIVRAAVYESTGPAWRLAAHGRLAAALREREAPATAVARHVERSARPGDADAIAVLTEAGHAAAPRAPAAAARWFSAALRLLPTDEEDPQRRLELLVPLARSLGASGQLEASREILGEVLEVLPPELEAVRGQVIAFMSLIQHLLGRHGEARDTLAAALEALPDPRSPEAAALRVELAADCFFLGEWDRMHRWATGALALARDAGDPRTHAAAAALLGLSCYELLRLDEAKAHVAEAKRIVDELPDDELALRVDACHWLGWVEHLLDLYDDSVRHMERGIAISRRTGQGHVLAPMTIGLVIANTWRGDLLAADRRTTEAIEIAHLAGSDQLMAWAQTMRCWVSGRLGDLDEAVAAGEEAVRIGDDVTKGPYTVVASCWLCDALVESGAAARGRDMLLAAVDGPDLANVEPAFRSCVYEVLTRAELALGAVDRAAEWAERGLEAVDGTGMPGRESFALRAASLVALARDDPERAAALALEAAEKAGEDYRVDAARAVAIQGRALSATGDREAAVEALRAACEELDRCGARRSRDQAVRELRRLGERVATTGRRGRDTGGVAALSEREREVADLVTDRFTNREIAERLVLSEKTVERHLSRIFQKLNVSSRVEVARAIEKDGAPEAAAAR